MVEVNNNENDIKLINSKEKYKIKVISNKSYHNILKLNDSHSINQINKDFTNILQKRDLMISIKKRKYRSIFKILYFINIDYFVRKMSRVRFHSMEAVGSSCNLMWWGPNWEGWINGGIKENIDK